MCFFFKQKTAYEIRSSDCSSDVCSSDLYWHDARDLDDRETLYMEAGDIRCVRRGDWKLAHYAGRDYGELYDLAADPWERRNLWDDPACREVRDDLRLRLLDEIIRVGPRAASPWNDRADPPSPEI